MTRGSGYTVGQEVVVKFSGEHYLAKIAHLGNGGAAYATFTKGATTKTVRVFASLPGAVAATGESVAA